MKSLLVILCCILCAASMHAQTLQWGNTAFSMVTDSFGNEVNDEGMDAFVFELGAFSDGFTPQLSNIDDWYSNWNVFDVAEYETNAESGGAGGVFTSTVNIVSVGGEVRSSYSGVSAIDFAGLDAYIWIRKGNDPVVGSEWLLTRASDWQFPTDPGEYCDFTDLQWSTSDLTAGGTPVPLWGRHYSSFVNGEYTTNSSGSSTLQTFTFIPEPSAFLMTAMTAAGLLLRRRRPSERA